jgi:hypothetical protein
MAADFLTFYSTADQLQPTGGPHNSLRTCLRVTSTPVCIIREGGLNYLEVMLKVWLNDKVVGHTKLGKTQRMIGLLYDVLKVMSYSF